MSASSTRYALASLLVVFMTLVIDHNFLQKDKTPIIVPASIKPAAVAETVAKISNMSLVNIALPLPPSFNKGQDAEQVKRDLPEINKSKSTVLSVEPIEKLAEFHKPKWSNPFPKTPSWPNKAQISQRLQQLVELKGVDRTLYFPEASTVQILAYMHNCVGIDIGAVKHNNLTLFSHKNNSHSQIVRAANGFKTQHEQALLAAYAPNQVLVRLYPRWFDEGLGKEIAASLGNQALTQLSGHYALRGQSLWLTKVKLNKKPLNKEWLLSQGC